MFQGWRSRRLLAELRAMRAELRAVLCQSFCAPTDARPWRILRSKSFSQEHDKKRGTAVGNLQKESYKAIQCRFLPHTFDPLIPKTQTDPLPPNLCDRSLCTQTRQATALPTLRGVRSRMLCRLGEPRLSPKGSPRPAGASNRHQG